MPETDDLPFTIDLWSDDELSIERQLAAVASLSIGRAAFDMAAVTYADRMVTLRGPCADEVYSPLQKPEPRLKGHPRWPARRVPVEKAV